MVRNDVRQFRAISMKITIFVDVIAICSYGINQENIGEIRCEFLRRIN